MTPTTPEQARLLATRLFHEPATEALHSLANQVEALTAELAGHKKDVERYIKRYSHYHYFGEGRNCASCGFDVTDPIHIRAAIKGAAT